MPKNTPSPSDPQHYFSESPDAPSRRKEFSVSGIDGELTLSTDAGVFSQHGLDKGTSVFLEVMAKHDCAPIEPGSFLCDIGCGSGAIALTLAVRYPECTIYAVDTNKRARDICTENATRNGLTNIVVKAPEEVDSAIRFASMWTNPPIRIGKSALHDLLELWLARLETDGTAFMVVNKNLGADSLSQWMTGLSYSTTRLASRNGFRVLEVKARA
ncbi:MAG: class I SAM-dependent methyltransferase [Ilumatobacteraceae bacterium]|jgi:16S rRNA G1207 methylase RsmC